MAKIIKEERLRWILPIFNKEVSIGDVSKICPYGKRTLERWLHNYKIYEEEGLKPKSTRPSKRYLRTRV